MNGLVGRWLDRQVNRIDEPMDSWVGVYLTGSSHQLECCLCDIGLDCPGWAEK